MSSRASRVQRGKRTHAIGFSIGFVFAAIGLIMVAGFFGTIKLCDSWVEDIPDYSSADAFNLAEPSNIYANDGKTLLASLYLENRKPVSASEVCDYVKLATVCTEDERFYNHNGIDVQGILRAIYVNIKSGGTSEGASTITQQFIRNTILIDEMNDITLKRKFREAYLAIKIEQLYDKEDILMMYLNTINYGDGAYGIQAAAQNYFSKDADELTLSESALLAGIPQAPSRLNPFNNYEAAISRRNTVLKRMLTNGAITQKQYEQALAETIVLKKKETVENGIYQQPYFVDYVKKQLLQNYTVGEIFKGGLTIITTLDMDMQTAAEEACYKALQGQAEDLEVALCSVDPDTGFIKAMFGGKDYNEDQYNLAAQAKRQCGSSFKVFTLTCAIENGMSPKTKFNGNSPITIGDWTVRNSGNASYGTISLEASVWSSLNTVFAQLIHQLTPAKVIEVAHRMGITSELGEHDAITLGTEGVTCLEMASAFGTLATGGLHVEPSCVEKIIDRNGTVIYEADCVQTRALSEEVSWAVTEVLEGDITKGTASKAKLDSDQVVACKTGTTQDYRDAYFVGYTPQLSTAIWMGTRIERQNITYNGSVIFGGTVCAPIFKNYMDIVMLDLPIEEFKTAKSPTYYLENESETKPVQDVLTKVYEYSDSIAKGEEIRRVEGEIDSTSNEREVTVYISMGPKPKDSSTSSTSGTSTGGTNSNSGSSSRNSQSTR